MKHKKTKRRLLLTVLLLLLLAAAAWMNGLLTEKIRANPIPAQTQAIVLTSTTDPGVCRVIDDPNTIARLRDAYRWTNAHMFCCMDKPQAYLDVVIGGVADGRERGEYHENLLTDSYNPAFRYLLYQAWKNAPEHAISCLDKADAVNRSLAADEWMYTRGENTVCIVSPE